jgi:hypothetical protein
MAKAGPDTNTENQGGFDSGAERVIGFSHMHDSGTGGVRLPRFQPGYSVDIYQAHGVRDGQPARPHL